jgi:hypothetical protein
MAVKWLALCLLPLPALAETPLPDYSDNRSSAADIVLSYYNAVNRNEYLRAYSYYTDGALGLFSMFEAGYADTAHVAVKLGEVTVEGAAGTSHYAVPVALQATDTAGRVTVFVGCYQVSQLQPAAQATPPFQPIQIDAAHMARSSLPFDQANGTCPEN